MVLPLFRDDGLDGSDGGLIFPAQLLQLVLKVAKDDALDGDRGRGDGPATEEPGDQAEHETANSAKPVAAAARKVAALQLSPEGSPMLLFVRLELGQFSNHARCREPSAEDLTRVDVHGSVLTCMVDLENA